MDIRLVIDLFWTFFKIGAFTIGGGWAMAPLIRRAVVERRKWLSDTEFLDGLAVAQASPGPLAVNVAVFIGHRVAGLAGLAAATLGAILPSFLAILVIAALFTRVETSVTVARFFAGARPAVLALIVVAVWELGRTALKDSKSLAFAAVAFLLVTFLHVHPSLVILGGIVSGLLISRKNPAASLRTADAREEKPR